MSLTHELNLKTPITPLAKEMLLNVYHTASCIKKKADEFFRRFGLSDVQFNVLLLLKNQTDPPDTGLSQAQISRMMLVNGANITSLIDRMEKADLVVRAAAPADRRSNLIQLTQHARDLLDQVEPLYLRQIEKTVVLGRAEQKQMITMMERLRRNLSELSFAPEA